MSLLKRFLIGELIAAPLPVGLAVVGILYVHNVGLIVIAAAATALAALSGDAAGKWITERWPYRCDDPKCDGIPNNPCSRTVSS